MMKLIKLLAFGLLVFGVSAGGSWFVMTKQHAPTAAAGAQSETGAGHDETAHTAAAPGASPSADPHAAEHNAAGAHDPAGHEVEDALPVVVRPKMRTVEDIVRNAQVLKAREEKLALRERAAEKEEVRLGLVQSDLQGEQVAIEALAADVKAEIEAANQLLTRILDEKASLDRKSAQNAADLKKFEETRSEMNSVEQQNIKQLSTWIQGMDATSAANFIKELSRDGKMDVAVQLLANFEEREASKILAALNDAKLMAELADKFRTFQRPTRTATNKK